MRKNQYVFLFCFFTLFSFSQEQLVNGISINAPNGFVKAGDLYWNKANENVTIQYFKGNLINQDKLKSICKKGTRSSDFVYFGQIEHNGENINICLQRGENTLSIGSTMIYQDGYTYAITVSAEPDDYGKVLEILGYMVTRIKIY